ncbi:hypothetical protein STENM327S_07610 [Streptomyces tendae]
MLVDPLEVKQKPWASMLKAKQEHVRAHTQRLRKQLSLSERRLRVFQVNVRRVVDVGLAMAEQQPLVDLSGGQVEVPDLKRGWERTVTGTSKIRWTMYGAGADRIDLLVARFDQLDRDSEGDLLRDVSDDDFYSGVVTVMMRVVFLLSPKSAIYCLVMVDDLYASGYSVGYLVEQLRTRAKYAGQQALAHRTAAWHRLLAVTRAVRGVAHEDLRMPAYGGELFDPDRYPWLEGRAAGDRSPPARATWTRSPLRWTT